MPPTKPLITLTDLRGGRNGNDPFELPEGQVVEALNVDYWDGMLANKRGGAANQTIGSVFADRIASLFRHVPGADETAAELWGVDAALTSGRMAGASTFAAVTETDAIAASPYDVAEVSFNGKLIRCYDSAQNRLHCWDPADSKVRRMGLATPAAATVANTGSGTYAATVRYYKVAYAVISGSDTLRRSELSAKVTFTPSGSGTAAVVTKPAGISEDETHWLLYASPDDSAYYLIATTVVATTTVSDSTAPASYSGDAPQVAGMNFPAPSAKYVVADDARLVLAGNYESSGGYTTPKNNRVWFTRVLSASDIGDDETIPNTTTQKNWIDVEAAITGLGGPLNGAIYVFAYRRIWKLAPTGVAAAPYRRFNLSREIGSIRHKSIVLAEDENGAPAMYWLSHRGPFRFGSYGLQYCGNDIEDLWATVNLAATVTCHGVYHADKHQIWWWIATGSNLFPETRLVLDVALCQSTADRGVIKGWTKQTGESCEARCSALFANTRGTTQSRDLKPHVGQTDAVNRLWKCDTADLDDAGTAFQSYIKTAPMAPYGFGVKFGCGPSQLTAKAASGVTITQTLDRDFGAESRTSTALLTLTSDEGSASRVVRKFDASAMGRAGYVQIQLGDSAAAANAWVLDRLILPVTQDDAP